MEKVSIKGVVLGGIIAVVATDLLRMPFLIYVSGKYGLFHLPKAEMGPAFARIIQTHIGLYLIGLAIGAVCSLLGGYFGARIARHDAVLNGLLSCWLTIVVTFYSYEIIRMTLLELAVEIPLAIFFAVIGGYLAARKNVSAAIRGA